MRAPRKAWIVVASLWGAALCSGCATPVMTFGCVETQRAEYRWAAHVRPSFEAAEAVDEQQQLQVPWAALLAQLQALEPSQQAQAARRGALALELEVWSSDEGLVSIHRHLFEFERDAQGRWGGRLAPAYPAQRAALRFGRGQVVARLVTAYEPLWGALAESWVMEARYEFTVWSDSAEFTLTLSDDQGRTARPVERAPEALMSSRLGDPGQAGLRVDLYMTNAIIPVTCD